MDLQAKEIRLATERMAQLSETLESLKIKQKSLNEIATVRAHELRKYLMSLAKVMNERDSGEAGLTEESEFSGFDMFDAMGIDLENERRYYLKNSVVRALDSVKDLRASQNEFADLQSKVNQERTELTYLIHDLQEKKGVLAAHEKLQKDFVKLSQFQRKERIVALHKIKDQERTIRGLLLRPSPAPTAGKETTQLAQVKPNQILPHSPKSTLGALKGILELPVQGKILEAYGKHFDANLSLLRFQKGLTIGIDSKQDVKACLEGEVAFSGELKGYGKVVILQHKDQIYTVYGHLGDVQVDQGKSVAKGQTLGSSGAEANVYFELREGNLAVNPLEYVAQNASQKI